METQYCTGCGENKSSDEIRTFRYGSGGSDELCRGCRRIETINEEYYKLEREEPKLEDDISELISDWRFAHDEADRRKRLVEAAKEKLNQHHIKMRDFDWKMEVQVD